MMFPPVIRNIDTPGDPDLLVRLNVVEKPGQRSSAAGTSGKPAMQAN
jgi:hypothetical protein